MPEGGIEDVTFSNGLSIEDYDKSSVSIRLDYSLSEKTTFTATFAGPHTGPSLCSNKAGLISLWYTEGSGTGIYYAEKRENDNGFLDDNSSLMMDIILNSAQAMIASLCYGRKMSGTTAKQKQ